MKSKSAKHYRNRALAMAIAAAAFAVSVPAWAITPIYYSAQPLPPASSPQSSGTYSVSQQSQYVMVYRHKGLVGPGAPASASKYTIDVTKNTADLNVWDAIGDPRTPAAVTVIVEPGATVYGDYLTNDVMSYQGYHAYAALSSGALPAGSTLKIVVQKGGAIIGRGGDAIWVPGAKPVGYYRNGGEAVYTSAPTTITNDGTIAGGGGGGGWSPHGITACNSNNTQYSYKGGGSGGGAGFVPGRGTPVALGYAYTCNPFAATQQYPQGNSSAGANGTATAGGAGGPPATYPAGTAWDPGYASPPVAGYPGAGLGQNATGYQGTAGYGGAAVQACLTSTPTISGPGQVLGPVGVGCQGDVP